MEASYASALRASENVSWKLEDVLPEDAVLDFGRPFLPEALAGTEALAWLEPHERRTLNHIRAHGYLCTFGLVEEFILPFVLDRLRARVDGDMDEVRALAGFAAEEAKHIDLFRRFRALFERSFGHRCDVIGPPEAIREHVLGHSELGVGLLILHIEWMTQKHYVEMIRADAALDPRFRTLLHAHWLEESQHALIDGWIVESVAAAAPAEERARAVDEYLQLLAFLDGGLAQQVELDRQALERAIGRPLDGAQRAELEAVQRASQRRTYLGAGLAHPRVRSSIERIHPGATGALTPATAAYA